MFIVVDIVVSVVGNLVIHLRVLILKYAFSLWVDVSIIFFFLGFFIFGNFRKGLSNQGKNFLDCFRRIPATIRRIHTGVTLRLQVDDHRFKTSWSIVSIFHDHVYFVCEFQCVKL